ncbi:MAG: hypothetical protein LBI57_06835 [Helicobacteraceae bacterium]|nr:hypothetical protein [Helicobacteraceae bacterium]
MNYTFVASDSAYYYVDVINTNDSATETKTASAVSAVAYIVIAGVNDRIVRFYDSNLDFNASAIVSENSIDLPYYRSLYDLESALYRAESSDNIANEIDYSLSADSNFYATPNVVEIADQAGLNSVRSALDGKYIMLKDIALSAISGENENDFNQTYGWRPIGERYVAFAGIFNGDNHKITGLWIDRPNEGFIGLFGYIDSEYYPIIPQIRNLGVEIANGKEVKGEDYVGAIAGSINHGALIANSYSAGTVKGHGSYIGGLAGAVASYNASIISCRSSARVIGDEYATEVGGITGWAHEAAIINSFSTGNVSGFYIVGGIAGSMHVYSSIINSYSTGNVSGNGGGVIGGIAGVVHSGSTIMNSYSTGDVIGIGVDVSLIGGIVGNADSGEATNIIKNSYSRGNVSGYHIVGGIFGGGYHAYCSDTGNTIQNNAAINPSVTGNSYVNRVVGCVPDSPSVSNNFALSTMSGRFTDSGTEANHGVSKTSVELKTRSTYEADLGWQFGDDDDNPWKIDSSKNNGYPYLYWQD